MKLGVSDKHHDIKQMIQWHTTSNGSIGSLKCNTPFSFLLLTPTIVHIFTNQCQQKKIEGLVLIERIISENKGTLKLSNVATEITGLHKDSVTAVAAHLRRTPPPQARGLPLHGTCPSVVVCFHVSPMRQLNSESQPSLSGSGQVVSWFLHLEPLTTHSHPMTIAVCPTDHAVKKC
jgi:hypothetical protein